MQQKLVQIALVVADYDEAISFYTQKLGFTLVEDTQLSDTKRWVVVSPHATEGCSLLLAQAATDEQKQRIGDQTGGRVFLFMYTDNFEAYFQKLLDNQVNIIRQPSVETYGTVAVFEDLYGNLWDLIQPAEGV